MSIEKLKLVVKKDEKTIHELIWNGDFEEWMLFGSEVIEYIDEYKDINITVEKLTPITKMMEETINVDEVYCIKWDPTGEIMPKKCYTDIERAKKRINHENNKLPWHHKLFGYKFVLETLKVREP